jgi:hypothetical protein
MAAPFKPDCHITGDTIERLRTAGNAPRSEGTIAANTQPASGQRRADEAEKLLRILLSSGSVERIFGYVPNYRDLIND